MTQEIEDMSEEEAPSGSKHRVSVKRNYGFQNKLALVRLKLSAPGYKEYDYNDAYKRWINNSERGRYNIGESCAVDM